METQRCLYEILEVETTASVEEIRSAYRKLALKWHPDKIQQSGASPEACQEATIQFQEIGRAYEVLADPAERSWYDSHRSQILSSSSSSSSDFDFNPWPYFSPSVFSGYGDTGKGFYAVYGDLFTKLHQQEQAFARSHGLRPPFDPPDMGGLASAYPQVQKFYSHWLGFSTLKDFSWCDEFRASAGPNRKLRRLMEEENKKIRSKARKEFNEAIRRLAAFVRKRDKRVLERQLEVQRLEKEKEEMLKIKRQKAEEEKMMKVRLYQEAEWTKVRHDEHDGDEGSDIDDSIGSYGWRHAAAKSSASKKDRQDEFYCIVCSKKFKSDEQWRNHERSKKHLDRVAFLKESFREEDEEIEALALLESENDVNVREDDNFVGGRAFSTMASEAESATTLETDDTNASNSETFGEETISTPVAGPEASPVDAVIPTTEGVTEGDAEAMAKGASGTKESDSSDVGSEEEDDELNSLLTMVNSYVSRQQQNASEGGNGVNEAQSASRQETRKEEHEEDRGEEEMLAAMLKSHQNMQQSEDDEDQVDDPESGSTSVSENKYDNLTEEFGSVSKKKKSKGKLRNERKQAASISRHSRLAEEMFIGKEVDSVMLKYESLGVNEEDAHCPDQELQDKSMMLERHAARGNKVEKNLLESMSVENGGQVNSSQEIRLSKGNKINGHATAPADQARKSVKGKKSKGNAKIATNTCETCGEDFESRNQLFKHISITKHAALRGK